MTKNEQLLREALQAIADIADQYAGEYPTQIGSIACAALAQPAEGGEVVTVTSKLGDLCSFRSASVRKGDKLYTTPPASQEQAIKDQTDDIIRMAREAGIDVQEGYVAYCDIDDLVCFFHMAQAAAVELTEQKSCANAALIAAAPDLLDALQDLVCLARSAMIEVGEYDIEAELSDANAAIAKAFGMSSNRS